MVSLSVFKIHRTVANSTMNSRPGYESHPFHINPFSFPNPVVSGERASVLCAVKKGRNLRYRWLKDGYEIHSRQGIHTGAYAGTELLAIESVSPDHEGNFTCVVTDGQQEESFTAELQVLGKFSLIA
jgi:hypothetical protein